MGLSKAPDKCARLVSQVTTRSSEAITAAASMNPSSPESKSGPSVSIDMSPTS